MLQLWEQGLVDLDAPAGDYLRAFRLIPAKSSFRPATVRHLLTHTAGVGYWRRLSDLLRPGVGAGIRAGRSGASPLADYYRRGLPVEVEPGTRWVYSNHGFAALGQLVEDVSGQSLDRYLREHMLAPLGMAHTDLVRSERVRPRLATGYVLRSRGLKPVADREVPTPGGGGVYSTTADLARYVAALLHASAGLPCRRFMIAGRTRGSAHHHEDEQTAVASSLVVQGQPFPSASPHDLRVTARPPQAVRTAR